MPSRLSFLLLALLAIIAIGSSQDKEKPVFIDNTTQLYYCNSYACHCKTNSFRSSTNIFIQCPSPDVENINVSIVRADVFAKLKSEGKVVLTVKNDALNNVPRWNIETFSPVLDALHLDLEITGTNLVSVESKFFVNMNIILQDKFSLIRNVRMKSIPSYFLSGPEEELQFSYVNVIGNGIESIESRAFSRIKVDDMFTLDEPNAIIHQEAFEEMEINGYLVIENAKTFPYYLKSLSKLNGLILKNFEFNEIPADSLPSTLRYLQLLNKVGEKPLVIDSEAFRNLPELILLTMTRCNIEELPEDLLLGSYFKLHELDLTSNRLRTFSKQHLRYQNRLKLVHLAQNQLFDLSSLFDGVFQKSWIPALNFLNVSYNNLTQIRAPMTPESERLQEKEKVLRVFLDKNPLRCDCSFKWMQQSWAADFISLSSATCREPDGFKSLQSVLRNNALLACKSNKRGLANIKVRITPSKQPNNENIQPDLTSNSESSLKIQFVIMVIIVTLVIIAAIVFIIYWKKRGLSYRYARTSNA